MASVEYKVSNERKNFRGKIGGWAGDGVASCKRGHAPPAAGG